MFRFAVLITVTFAFAAPPAPAQPPETQRQVVDRRQFLNEVQTSDDPRRVPAPPGPRGPDGTRVLYGGFIFDGTGSDSRIGTIVIERNRIAAIQAVPVVGRGCICTARRRTSRARGSPTPLPPSPPPR